MLDRFDNVVDETVRVREELGYPIMVTPFAQLVVTQALLNVISKERYKIVPDEVKKYALGYYGQLLAPVAPNALDRIIGNGSASIRPNPQTLDPGLDKLRKTYPSATDEERLLRVMFAGSQVDEMLAAGPMKTQYDFKKPLVDLLNELTKRRKHRHVYIRKGSLELELGE
jgi:oxaloacetate decarboxylase alpha subunit